MSRIAPLTALRFFAAMMVVAHHYWGLESGYVGVGFFYVLSGYVLAYNYSKRVGDWTGRRDFWFRRFARIYPTHLLTLLISLPLATSAAVVPANALLLQSWIPVPAYFMSVNWPSWSISDEAFFYAMFPLLLGIRARWLLLWGFALFGATLAWPGTGHYPFYVFPLSRLFEFALGAALARGHERLGLPAEITALGLAAVSIAVLPLIPAPFKWSIAFIPASVLLVYVFARSEGPVARLLSNRWLVLLGDASFMLYMIHWPLMVYLGRHNWVVALSVVLSVALYLWFEKPVQKWLKARWRSGHVPSRGQAAGSTA